MNATERLRHDLLQGPDFFPHKLDLWAQTVLFVRLSREQFRHASFLDDRIITPQTQGVWHRLASTEACLAGAPPGRPVHFIFHTGHVGSTLLSRLLEAAGGVLALREPLALRTLAELADDVGAPHALYSEEALDRLLRLQILLWSRGYDDTNAVIVKATSAAARLGPRLLACSENARAIYLSLSAEPYLATLLAGANSPIDLRGLGRERFMRVHRLADCTPQKPLHALSLGELAAMTWTAETLTAALLARTGRVLPMDFERLLQEPAAHLGAALAHFGIPAPKTYLETIENAPLWRRYAKAPEADYSPQMRAQILAEARLRHAGEIAKGLRWIEALAQTSPAVTATLAASAS